VSSRLTIKEGQPGERQSPRAEGAAPAPSPTNSPHFCREYDRVAANADPALRGSWPSKAQFYRWISGELIRLSYPDHCRILEGMFPGWKVDQLFQTHDGGIDFIPEPPPPQTQTRTIRPLPPTTPANQSSATTPQALGSIEQRREASVNGQAGWRSSALATSDTDKNHTREVDFGNNCDLVKASQRSWHDVRKYVGLNQAKLHARAAELYAPSWRLPQAPMLSQPSWLPGGLFKTPYN
jgi:hypothetical protein